MKQCTLRRNQYDDIKNNKGTGGKKKPNEYCIQEKKISKFY
jgi:hypothetical protein